MVDFPFQTMFDILKGNTTFPIVSYNDLTGHWNDGAWIWGTSPNARTFQAGE